jgi:Flp pilus assembly pilin Flp
MQGSDFVAVRLAQFAREECGATFYEAVLVVSLLAVVCIIVLLALGKSL